MSEKLDNEEFRVERIDGNVLKGDANKLKLLLASNAAIMEVQAAYIEEEIRQAEEERSHLEAQLEMSDGNNVEDINMKMAELDVNINIMEESQIKFHYAHNRFLSLAKRALSLPDKNFQKLVANGYYKKVSLEKIQSSIDEAQAALSNEENNIFSSVDTDAIKQEVEDIFNKQSEKDNKSVASSIVNDINSDTFNDDIEELAQEVKNKLDKKRGDSSDLGSFAASSGNEEITEDDFDRLLNAVRDSSEDEYEDVFSRADEVSNTAKDFNETGPSIPILPELPDNNFDFSDDPELKEILKEIEEIRKSYDSSKEILATKTVEEEKLNSEVSSKEEEAKTKYQQASMISEKMRAAAREKRVAEERATLATLKSQLLDADRQIREKDENIASINSRIKRYQASIAKSDEIINSYTESSETMQNDVQMSSDGGRKNI